MIADAATAPATRPRRIWAPVRALLWEQWRERAAAFAILFCIVQVLVLLVDSAVFWEQALFIVVKTTAALSTGMMLLICLVTDVRMQRRADALTPLLVLPKRPLPVSVATYTSVFFGFRAGFAFIAVALGFVHLYLLQNYPNGEIRTALAAIFAGVPWPILFLRTINWKERAVVLAPCALLGGVWLLEGSLTLSLLVLAPVFGFGVIVLDGLRAPGSEFMTFRQNDAMLWKMRAWKALEAGEQGRCWKGERWPKLAAQLWYESRRRKAISSELLFAIGLSTLFIRFLLLPQKSEIESGVGYVLWDLLSSGMGPYSATIAAIFLAFANCSSGEYKGTRWFSPDNYWRHVPLSPNLFMLVQVARNTAVLRWLIPAIAPLWVLGAYYFELSLTSAAGMSLSFVLAFAWTLLLGIFRVGPLMLVAVIMFNRDPAWDLVMFACACGWILFVAVKGFRTRILLRPDIWVWLIPFLISASVYGGLVLLSGFEASLHTHLFFGLVAPLFSFATMIHPYINARGR